MRRIAPCAVLALLGACGLPHPHGDGVTLHTVTSGGYRAVDHEVFDGHAAYSLEFVTRDPDGWGYELGGTYGAEDVGGPREHSAEFDELFLGLRRSWHGDGPARPYLGFGGAFTRIENDLSSPRTEFDDEGGGAYAHGGVLWLLGPLPFERRTEFLVGFDVRGLVGDDYDYVQAALVLGFGR